MAENLAYNKFKKFYTNLIDCGGNIGTIDMIEDGREDRIAEIIRAQAKWVRKNLNHVNYDLYVKNISGPTTDRKQLYRDMANAIKHIWMSQQDIIFKPVTKWQDRFIVHPGSARLAGRWAQGKSAEVIYLDYKVKPEQKYKKFKNLNEAWEGLTYKEHTIEDIHIRGFDDIEYVPDGTFDDYKNYYMKNGFLYNIHWAKDKNFEMYDELEKIEIAKKCIGTYLNDPIIFGIQKIFVDA